MVTTIAPEVEAQIATAPQCDHLPALQQLAQADTALRALFASRVLQALCNWPETWPERAAPLHARHLVQILRVLRGATDPTLRTAIANECSDRYAAQTDATTSVAIAWLTGLFEADAVRATDTFIDRLDQAPPDVRAVIATSSIGNLFGPMTPIDMVFPNPLARATHLVRLLRVAYRYIDPADDIHHTTTYTPGPRDHAESGRSFLFSALLDTPGPSSHAAILSLTDCGHVAFPDRIRLLARRRAATDAEPKRCPPGDVVALNTRHETPPRSADQLRALVLDRLADIAYDYQHGDFSNRHTIGGITLESEMQCTLGQRLRDRANGAYEVTREAEVADRRRTDIRISTPSGQAMAIEIKIANNWSGPQLEEALAQQLLSYLRDADCNAGCLLLVHRDRRKWRPSGRGPNIDFRQLVDHLSEKAATIETARSQLRLAVFGLDLGTQSSHEILDQSHSHE